MNKIIKEQLLNCKVARIPSFDEDTIYLKIEKSDKLFPQNMLNNHVYLVKLSDYLLKDETLASNWNMGNIPEFNYYKLEKIGEIGNMIKVNGIAFDYYNKIDLQNKPFYGYLPVDGFEIIEEV